MRRIGKSTLRRYVVETLRGRDQPVAFIDAQGLHSVADLLAALFAALPKEEGGLSHRMLSFIAKDSPIRSLLEALAKGTKTGDNVVSAYWREAYNGIREALASSNPPPTLVIDEFSFLLKNMLERAGGGSADEANQLLAALREWRERGMKMLLTGSIGVTALARRHGLQRDHLNDLLPFDVPELSEAEARAFIDQAVQTAAPAGQSWTKAHTDEFLHQCGVLYPSFLVKGLLELDLAAPPKPDELAAIFANHVRPVLHEDFYNQFAKRFRSYDEIDAQCRQALVVPALQAVMTQPDGATLDDLNLPAPYNRIDLAEFMDMLVEDGFVTFSEDEQGLRQWRPASHLAQLWWRRSRLA
ncbi:MAG: hypothetical protein JNN30_13465 [Rhodanobacteraceae bacterium]|nr:hypothetical protein [Rhodanobacteraceae bacterium]